MNKDFVSVIVPVYNDEERIWLCIESLLNQTYNNDCYEIIVIDNNSTDNTLKIINNYPVIPLSENEIQSSYAARNKWLKKAKWNILAFTDSDCEVDKDWILNWVNSLKEKKSDLVAWNIRFKFEDKSDIYEIYDSIKYLQQEDNVKKWSAVTANVFIYKYVFDDIWNFDSTLKSWGDSLFTRKSTSCWYKLSYEKSSIVYHPARKKKETIEKILRVSCWRVIKMFESRKIIKLLLEIIIGFFPPIRINYNKLENRDKNIFMYIKIFLVSYELKIYYNYWRFRCLYNIFIKNKWKK